ncbi:unnamed protein product [Prunus armeniaca]|uniref:Uncharacterized protein n=1 Tax=Prunus armeniaca TaxID=36596 RepID=A0A6J5UVT2_PRUAR|nr:unnamed protein product [Prunus armeniaca]CAB4309943.1 unnamed protein product [Prunus armeniaca]
MQFMKLNSKEKMWAEKVSNPQHLNLLPRFLMGVSFRLHDSSATPTYLFLPENQVKGLDASSAKSPCGHIFDVGTRLLHRSTIPQSKSFKPNGLVFSAYEKIYYISSLSYLHPFPKISFEKYDPDEKTWVSMPPFPFFNGYHMNIEGYAVCYGVILFSLGQMSMDFDNVAFHEIRKGRNGIN